MKTTITRQFLVACALHALWTAVATAQLYSPVPLVPVLNPDNGHYYQLVYDRFQFPPLPRQFRFEDALSRAESASHLGISGHLVTITSQAEQEFLVSSFLRP